MKKNILVHLMMVIIALIPLLYLAIAWSSIPEQVPLHFDINMQPDRIGSKNELWLLASILAGVSLLVYVLLINLKWLDPKRRTAPPSNTFTKIAVGTVIFLAVLNILLLVAATDGQKVFEYALFPLLGLVFAFLGNYMNNIKPNYFAGFRLPWTLSDDDNWRRTHKLAGKLWFAGGLLIILLSLLFPIQVFFIIFIIIMSIITLIPVVYSFLIFRKKNQSSGA